LDSGPILSFDRPLTGLPPSLRGRPCLCTNVNYHPKSCQRYIHVNLLLFICVARRTILTARTRRTTDKPVDTTLALSGSLDGPHKEASVDPETIQDAQPAHDATITHVKGVTAEASDTFPRYVVSVLNYLQVIHQCRGTDSINSFKGA
jgi:hypothetical protein